MCLATTKVVICQLLAVCILGFIQDRNITKAIDLGTTLLEHVEQWAQDALPVQYCRLLTYSILLLLNLYILVINVLCQSICIHLIHIYTHYTGWAK